MTVQPSDIVTVLSGGNSNSDPSASIGGSPSVHPVQATLNNLFDNVSQSETVSGAVDYRCVYIFNNNSESNLFNTQVILESQVMSGATVEIGIESFSEVQKITISGDAQSGSLTLGYEEEEIISNYNSDSSAWASDLQTAIRAIEGLEESTVVATDSFERIEFQIDFIKIKSQPLLTVESNDIPECSVVVSRLVSGAPVNATAQLLDFETQAPNFVGFSSTTLEIGTLGPTEGFAVWIKRTTESGVNATEADGFSLRIKGSPIVI